MRIVQYYIHNPAVSQSESGISAVGIIINTYWATSSPISEVSMLPYTMWATAKPEPTIGFGSILTSGLDETESK